VSGPEPHPEALARAFHEAYERLAPSFGYETRKDTAVPWEDVPEPNRSLMIAVAAEVGDVLVGRLEHTQDALRDVLDVTTGWSAKASDHEKLHAIGRIASEALRREALGVPPPPQDSGASRAGRSGGGAND
jgi:hypothetical protein